MNITGNKNTITFDDGFVVHLGDKVRYSTRHASEGIGIVIGFNKSRVLILADHPETLKGMDRWPLTNGGFYNRLESVGLAGGELQR